MVDVWVKSEGKVAVTEDTYLNFFTVRFYALRLGLVPAPTNSFMVEN